MAQLNCPTCHHGVVDPWNQMQDTGGSNMSLNMTPGYPMNPMWMGTWHGPPPSTMGMYPYPMGMPPPMAHMHSSRPSSPAHSVKSRKSHLSKKSRRRHDSDSDVDDIDDIEDRRSVFSQAERGERKSNRLPERTRLRDTASMPRELPRRSTTLDRMDRLSTGRNHRNLKSSTSQDSDDERESQKVSVTLNESDEDRNVESEKKLKIPKNSWECEHCTFVNESSTRVCTICCKTPTSNVKLTNAPADNHQEKPRTGSKTNRKDTRRIRRSISKESSSEIEAITNKIDKLISHNNNKMEEWNGRKQEDINRKEGRNRKITFWPGTKFPANLQ